MAESSTAFETGARVQFKDGQNTRVGFVVGHEAASDTHPDGYAVLFKIKENGPNGEVGQNRISRIATSDLSEARAEHYAFKVGAEVGVLDVTGKVAITGKIHERAPMDQDTMEPRYAVLFKDETGQTALAWWAESVLSAAS